MDANKKYWASLSLDGIGEAVKKCPKRYKTSEQYGKQLTADVKVWDDGNATVSVSYQDANGEWQRINIASIRESKDQGQAAPAPAAAPTSDLPF